MTFRHSVCFFATTVDKLADLAASINGWLAELPETITIGGVDVCTSPVTNGTQVVVMYSLTHHGPPSNEAMVTRV